MIAAMARSIRFSVDLINSSGSNYVPSLISPCLINDNRRRNSNSSAIRAFFLFLEQGTRAVLKAHVYICYILWPRPLRDFPELADDERIRKLEVMIHLMPQHSEAFLLSSLPYLTEGDEEAWNS